MDAKCSLGLALGVLMALFHALWQVLVFAGVAKKCMDWVLQLHSMEWSYTMLPFSFCRAVFLVIFTFAVGFVVGWVIAGLYKLIPKK